MSEALNMQDDLEQQFQDDNSLEDRLKRLADDQERLESEAKAIRGQAEDELLSIDPKIEDLRRQIGDLNDHIAQLEHKKEQVENFIGKMNAKGHPLRRSSGA